MALEMSVVESVSEKTLTNLLLERENQILTPGEVLVPVNWMDAWLTHSPGSIEARLKSQCELFALQMHLTH